jgi:hypothetical protein
MNVKRMMGFCLRGVCSRVWVDCRCSVELGLVSFYAYSFVHASLSICLMPYVLCLSFSPLVQ